MKRFLALLLALVTVLNVLPLSAYAITLEEYEKLEENALQNTFIYADGDEVMDYLMYDGSLKLSKFYLYDNLSSDGKMNQYPAYCLMPYKPGASTYSHQVSTTDYISNPKIYGIITNGYPYKTLGELGLATKQQAFYATKMAMWTYIESWDVNKWTASPGFDHVLTAMKNIYHAGMAFNEIPTALLSATPDKTVPETDSQNSSYVSLTYTVSSNVQIKSYSVYLEGDVPTGASTADLQNNAKSEFEPGEQFKVLIPANSISGQTGDFRVSVIGLLKTNAIIYGISYDTEMQSYAVTRDPFNFERSTSVITYSSQNTYLKILKTASGSSLPLSGAVFRVSDSNGNVIGIYTTDGNGSIVVPLTESGKYYVDEITPPNGYVLGNDAHKEVTVTWDSTAAVTFTNETMPELVIQKTDADTGTRLAGAIIRVAYEGGLRYTDVTTDSAGMAYINDLEPGVYTITEITAPDGYLLNSSSQTVILESGKTAEITLKNSAKPDLVIKKYDEYTGMALAGAEFSVAKKGGSIVYEGITDETGIIRLENLETGWYTITELAAPKGYLIAAESKDVYLESGKSVEVKFDNRLKPALQIVKLDSQTKQPLSGAVFEVRKAGSSSGTEHITDENGTITINDLDEAVYIVTEKEAPTDYLNEYEQKEIELQWGVVQTLVFTNKAKPSLEILKVDEETKEPLAGAKFRISETEGAVIGEYITDANGHILIKGLNAEIYSIEEISAPEGYLLEPQHKDVKLEWGQTTSLVFSNKTSPALEILKVDEETKKPLAGAKFRVTATEGNTVSEHITDADGRILIRGLEEKTYSIEEITAPDGYLLESQHKDIQLEWGKTKTIVFTNKARPSLEIIKLDEETRVPLAGAKFRVNATDGNTVGEYITDSNGRILITSLNDGTYTIEETAAPDGYLLETQHKDILLEWGKTKSIIFTNKARPALEIIKLDEETREPLAGAKFRITATDGNTIGEYITDSNGRILVTGLNDEKYTIEEIAAPIGYLLETQHKDILLEWGKTKSIIFTNKARPALEIIKLDEETREPLAGAKFRVTATDGNTIGEYITDSNGHILVTGLNDEIYTIEEIAAPSGYLLETQHKDILLEWGKTKSIIFTNKARPALEIIKLDEETREPLTGAKFRVTATESSTVSEYITDSDGRILITDLNDEIYTIEEIAAPSGYLLETQHKDILLEWGKTKSIIFTNKARPALEIKKIDTVTGEPLAGARFQVTKTEDLTVSEYVTGADGTILIKNLEEAIYTAEETSAPDGYLLDPQKKSIQLEWGVTKTLVYEDIKKPTLIITKTDALTYSPIPNTTFKIEHETDNGGISTLGTYRTDNNGQIILPQVEPGWYVITESIAAQGYSLPTNPVTRKYLSPGENAYADLVSYDENELLITSGSDYCIGTEIMDYPLNSIVIRKTNYVTGELLPGAVFEVRRVTGEISGSSGTLIGRYTTDHSGTIVITGLAAGGYIIEEVQAPAHFLLSENSQQQVWLKADGTSIVEAVFANIPYGSILITKTDAQTGKPLANARFRVTDSSGAVVGNTNGEYITDETGEFLVENVKPGSYMVTEIEAPENYAIDTTPQTVNVGTDGKIYKVSFTNQPAGTLVIRKLDSITKEPLADAEFKVMASDGSVVGLSNGIFTTDEAGTITIPHLAKGSYIIEETKAPSGYILENKAQTVAIDYGKTYTLDFYNKPKSGLQILKIDSETKEPLKGAKFTVYKKSGELLGSYTTDKDGLIIMDGLEPGWYKIVETKAPDGYVMDDTVQDIEATYNQFIKVTFENKKMTSLIIKKIDEITGRPLSGAKFKVEKQNGEYVGEYTTDSEGIINIPVLEPDWYIVRETKAPSGYHLDETPKTVEVKTVTPAVVTFSNKPLSGIEIVKIDATTKNPLSGATFTVEHSNGVKIGTYKTDSAGKILVSSLSEGTYIVSETIAPDGYILSDTPKTVVVKSGRLTTVEFTNNPLSELQIKKIDSVTRQPVQGAQFTVNKINGERVGTYKTDKNGLIYLSGLEPGWYTLSETKAPAGYILDASPRNVEIKSGNPIMLEIENTPMSSLLIIKTDSDTKEPLYNVGFDVAKENGEVIGRYTTDKNGRIYINDIEAGTYVVTEKEALKGYELDTTAHKITVSAGKQTVLEVTNTPLAGLRLIKVDSITKEPIYNVEFMVFDANNKAVGTFYTDNNGVIDFSAVLTEGRYTIRETRAASGYYLDETPKTVEFVAGKVTEIIWTNTPKMGQIQILKKSGDNNEVNGLPAGTPLEGAVFEVYEYKTENLVDRFVSGSDGKAVSSPLPLGRYTVKEVQAPQYYKLSNKELDIEIEFATQIIKKEYLNYSANTGVYIKKTGNVEAMPGDTIRYDIKAVQNTSTVPLSSFYWRDMLPTSAVRLSKIVTGTYNQSLKYKITATTNKGDAIIVADNLSTTKNHVINCSNASLGLGSDEYVTSFTLVFGTVKAGFAQVDKPQIYVNVVKTLPNGYQFANKCDVGGKYGNEWVVSNSTWLTTIYANSGILPKTGY